MVNYVSNYTRMRNPQLDFHIFVSCASPLMNKRGHLFSPPFTHPLFQTRVKRSISWKLEKLFKGKIWVVLQQSTSDSLSMKLKQMSCGPMFCIPTELQICQN